MKNQALKKLALTIPISLLIFLFSHQLNAQRAAGAVGIGAQFGQPTGLTVKVYQPQGISTDILAAWDLNDFFFVNLHGLVERHIGSSEKVHYFIGPGVFAGIRDGDRNDIVDFGDETVFTAGISGSLGLNVMISNVELYGQFTPRLELVDRTEGSLGGGIGIRFYIN